ncbi:MAG TPA: SDR family oxidoreductase [Kofleriaceae bacterium]|nr:SDR family oxidoreductase [Kofleriaceae bacterium]
MARYHDICGELEARPRRWLVTGAAGFIGSALVEKLLALGQHVVGIDSFVTGRRANLDDVRATVGEQAMRRFQLIEGDIRDLETCRRASGEVDVVLHQAALGSVPRSIEDPIASHQANVDGTVNVLVAAHGAGIKRVVYASSSSVYGDHPGLPKVEEAIGRPLSPYAATKRIDEVYADVWQRSFGLETVGLRYFNVYGRRQDPEGPYAAVIPRWIAALASGSPCVIFGDGSQSRDFCYVDNAVQANILAAVGARDTTGEIYNVGLEGRTDLVQLFRMLRDRVAAFHPQAAGAEPTFAAPRPGDVQHSQASIDKIRQRLGYQPTHGIDEGLTETVSWFLGGNSG